MMHTGRDPMPSRIHSIVVWDLVLRSADRYAWHRADWVRGGYTREIQRCPGESLMLDSAILTAHRGPHERLPDRTR